MEWKYLLFELRDFECVQVDEPNAISSVLEALGLLAVACRYGPSKESKKQWCLSVLTLGGLY